jgi:glycosyltransferase involved in cell wall biosynthesis
MRLLMISNAFPDTVLGGYEHAARDISDVAFRCGWEVVVLTSNWPASSTEDMGTALRLLKWDLPGLRPSGLKAQFDEGFVEPNAGIVEEVIAKFRPDRILLMNLQGLGVASILSPVINSGVPTTAYLMDNWPRIRTFHSGLNFDWLLSPLLRHSGIQWIACSRTLAREIELFSGGAVVPNNFVPAWVEVTGVPVSQTVDPRKILFVSSLSREKGAFETLEACIKMLNRFPDMSLDIFGDGPFRNDLETRALVAPEGSINFHGWVSRDQVRQKLANYGSLVFPTWSREPFGFVILEAMAAGVPVVTTIHGGTERMPDDCYVPCTQSADSVARAVSSLIEDSALVSKVVGNALKIVRDEFEQESVIRTLLDKIRSSSERSARFGGLRQSSTLEVLGFWLENQDFRDTRSHVQFGRVLKIYYRLPFAARRFIRPIGLLALHLVRQVKPGS